MSYASFQVFQSGKLFGLKAEKGQNLLRALRERGFVIKADCSGAYTCGKCKVKIEPTPEPTEADKRLLTESEIAGGIRLACAHEVFDGITVTLPDTEEIKSAVIQSVNIKAEGVLKAALDIGTTTLSLCVFNQKGEILGSVSGNNPQSSFGADVISRIKAERDFPGVQHNLLISKTNEMSESFFADLGISKPLDLFVCGNTVMLHFFFGESPVSMGEYPYTPVFLESKTADGGEIGLKGFDKVCSLSCLAPFAGADITAGILSLYEETDDYKLLIDLGTNAEIALFNKERCFVATAAAGPAFEGANIRCGMPSISGAVKAFKLINGNIYAETIDNKELRGICGSGLISIAAELIRNRIVDKTGRMFASRFEISENVAIYPEDIRELQLSKAAVRAAAEEIIERSGIGYSDISRLCLSGGFGTYINTDDAAFLGLFPPELKEKAEGIGNSAIRGCVMYASDEKIRSAAERIVKSAQVFDLAVLSDFSEKLIKHIDF